MKRVGLTIAAAAVSLWAQEGGPRPGFGPEGGFIRFSPALSVLDADKDGTISGGELRAASAALSKLDKNGDGQLTEDEVRPMRRPGGPGGPGGGGGANPEEMVKTLLAFDRNSDGKLTRDEVPERMQGIFARGDSDKDGVLSGDELKKMAEAQSRTEPGGERERREGFGREGGRGEGGPRGERRGPGGPGGFMRMDRSLAALDTNGDAIISADELKAASASLAKLDQNGDGQLTEEEVRPQFGRGFGRPGGRQDEHRDERRQQQ